MSRKIKRKIKKKTGSRTLPIEYARLLHQGDVFAGGGNLREAELSYRQAIKVTPGLPQAYLKMAYLFKNYGRIAEAGTYFSKALGINPKQPEVLNDFGLLLHFQGEFSKAAVSLKQAIKQRPGYWIAQHNLSNTLQEMGDIEGAQAACQRALELKPDMADLHFNKARLQQNLDLDDAWIASCRRALELDPEFALAHLLLSRGIKHCEYDADMAAMEELYSTETSSAEQKIYLGFALGKAFEDLGDFEKAFEFYAAGNRLKRQTCNYRLSADTDYFARIRKLFSAEFLASLPETPRGEPTPIFILGMPRSGTSLVEQILASHLEVVGGGELWVLENLVHPFYQPEAFAEVKPRRQELRKTYLDRVSTLPGMNGAPFFTDKMPHNFIHIGMIRLLLPEAKIIHCCRNPMDTCLSIYKNLFMTGHPYSYDQQELGGYYQLYAEMMDYWHKVLPGYIYDISYEKLVVEPEEEIRTLLAFCGLEWDDRCLNFHETKRSVSTLSVSQVRKPIYQDSVKLSEKYGDNLNELKNTLGSDLKQ